MKFIQILLIVICASLTACASTKKLSRLSLGMTKDQVVQVAGEPQVARGTIRNKFGQVVEVWEYQLNKPKRGQQLAYETTATVATFGLLSPILLSPGESAQYWLYFVNGKLAQWGQAGDWRAEADRIYEVRFNTGQGL